MRIDTDQISPEGLILEEILNSEGLDLNTEGVKFQGPLRVKAEVRKITNTVVAKTEIQGSLRLICARCVKEIDTTLAKNATFTYPLKSTGVIIFLDEDIRQEVMLSYPIKSLCKPDCKGLCPVCGKDLNEEKCRCKE